MPTATQNRELQAATINRAAKLNTLLLKVERFGIVHMIDIAEDIESLLRRIANCTCKGAKGHQYLTALADSVAELERYLMVDETGDDFDDVLVSTRLGYLTTPDAKRAAAYRKSQIEAERVAKNSPRDGFKAVKTAKEVKNLQSVYRIHKVTTDYVTRCGWNIIQVEDTAPEYRTMHGLSKSEHTAILKAEYLASEAGIN